MQIFDGNAPARPLAKLAPTLAKLVAVAALVGVIFAKLAVWSLVLGIVILAGAAVLGLWGAANEGRRVRAGLVEGQLRFGDGRFHVLAPGSLFAVRGAEVDDLCTRYTIIHVQLDSGSWRVLAFMDMVPDGAYTKQPKRREDIWFEPDQNELLQLLAPFVRRADERDAAAPARYTIPLRGPIGELSDYDKIIIEGDAMTLQRSGKAVASARREAISCEPHVFMYRPNVLSHPEGNPELALRMSFPGARAPLTIVGPAAWRYSLPSGLPRLETPRYSVGAGELFRLKAWVEGPRPVPGDGASVA